VGANLGSRSAIKSIDAGSRHSRDDRLGLVRGRSQKADRKSDDDFHHLSQAPAPPPARCSARFLSSNARWPNARLGKHRTQTDQCLGGRQWRLQTMTPSIQRAKRAISLAGRASVRSGHSIWATVAALRSNFPFNPAPSGKKLVRPEKLKNGRHRCRMRKLLRTAHAIDPG